jgi:membrane protein YdbS with pleckstrin-like domain
MEVFMSNIPESPSSSIIWQGRPWIAPAIVSRTIVVFLVAAVIVGLEYASATSSDKIAGVSVVYWTIVAFFVIWLIGIAGLVVQRATNLYTLKNDSLEIRTGILTSRSFVVVASGFSDLEVIRGVVGRIIEYGNITIRMQSERSSVKVMVKVRDPLKVAEQIRYVMGRPIVRLETPITTEKKQ